MKNYLFIIPIFLGLFFLQTSLNAQNIPISEEQAKAELNKRGLSEEEVSQALLESGIDIDNLENATPEELLKIEEILKKLETKKNVLKENEIKEEAKKIEKDTIKVEKELVEKKADTKPKGVSDKIFAHNLLSIEPIGTKKLTNISEYYILGSGDVISISIWSDYSQFDDSYTIDNDGYIKIDKRNIKKRVYLKGLTLNKGRKKIKKILSNYLMFKSGEINISLESSRAINISIYGEVNRPGSFSIEAVNNIFEGLKYAKGVTGIGSVRNIKVLSSNGKFKQFDLYEYVDNPKYGEDFYLNNNDIIHIPVASKLIEISGAINRPFIFELLEEEGIKDLLSYAGGFTKDAIKDKIQVERFIDNKKVFIGIDLFDKRGKLNNFVLKNGDKIVIRKIEAEVKNYVEVKGSVFNTGRFERTKGMIFSEVLNKSGLRPEAKTDFAIIMRKNIDGTTRYISVNIDSVYNNIGKTNIDLKLFDEDIITVWAKSRFVDKMYISVQGAVRDPGEYPYGSVESINVLSAIKVAGGLLRNASSTIILHRQDPLRKYEIEYIKLDLERIINNPNSTENLILKPFDKLEILSKNLFNETTFVTIRGAVNNPGTIQYGENMTLNDLIVMAGGFRKFASTNNIEVSRIIIKDNKPTKVIVAKKDLNRDLKNTDKSHSYILEPYDVVIVRSIPDFELQKIITIKGEVKYPGKYTLISENEKVIDVIERAGGLTNEAFEDGATLYREKDDVGFIVMRLEDALNYKKSKYNYILKNLDVIDIPKQKDFVTIKGATKSNELYKDEIAYNKNGINVPFHKGKRAMFYIDNYAGGINDSGSKMNVFVEHANGEISKTINYGLFKLYPKVRKGSTIKVGIKKKKTKENKEKNEVDWNKIITNSVAQISTIMTLVILFKSISQ